MEFIAIIPAGFVFLFALYKFIKDDYVFIRKGVSLEQAFDIAFICFWISIFFSRLFYLIFHRDSLHILLNFFSIRYSGLSLVGGIIGGIIGLYFVSKAKRLPLGRLSDFISLSLLLSLPVGYLTGAILYAKISLLHLLLNSFSYFIVVIFFIQFLYPKLMNRTLREGSLSVIFLMTFACISLLISFLDSLKSLVHFLTEQNFFILLVLLFATIIFVKQERPFIKPRRSLHH